jgi:hypothetical protein
MIRQLIPALCIAGSSLGFADTAHFTQSEVIRNLTAQTREPGNAYAVLSLGKSSANPDACERDTRNAFAIDRSDENYQELFRKAVDAFVAETVVSFEIKGCVDGYPKIVQIEID